MTKHEFLETCYTNDMNMLYVMDLYLSEGETLEEYGWNREDGKTTPPGIYFHIRKHETIWCEMFIAENEPDFTAKDETGNICYFYKIEDF